MKIRHKTPVFPVFDAFKFEDPKQELPHGLEITGKHPKCDDYYAMMQKSTKYIWIIGIGDVIIFANNNDVFDIISAKDLEDYEEINED